MNTEKKMHVIKRSGKSELISFDKITNRLQKLLFNLCKYTIDPNIITQKICSRIYSGITTTELDNLSAQMCTSMICDHPDYGELGSRIIVSNHQKNTSDNFLNVIKELYANKDINGNPAPLINEELYSLVQTYHDQLEEMIDYSRDYLIDYFGFKTLERSYLLKINCNNKKKIVERPQHLFMRVALGIHGDDLVNVKQTYDRMSKKEYTHATPTLFNAGTPINQLASCFLTGINDSIEGIFDTYKDCGIISKFAGGIGIHISNIRSKGSYIRKTGGNSDGLMPLLKTFNSVARQFNQGGKRLGSFAMYLEVYHADIFTFLEAKKNSGSDEERARDLFYALWISDLFMERVEKNEEWYLMDPNVCPDLNEFYGEEFNTLYLNYVSKGKYVKKIKARELWEAIISSQIEHGMPYMLYKDHANEKSNQKNIGIIKSSNLCSEIMEVSSENEIAVCNLASICLPALIEPPSSFKGKTEIYYYGKLKLYSKEDCSYCKLLKQLLNERHLDYEEISEKEAREYLPSFTTVPQLFSEYNEKVYSLGGYDDTWQILQPIFNYDKLEQFSYELTINLNRIIDKNYYPNEKTKKSNMNHRPIGIGVQGLANVFMQMRLPFTSDKAREINKLIFETMYHGAMRASVDLAKKDGAYSTFQGSPLSKGIFQFNLWGVKDEETSGKWDWSAMREQVMTHGVRNSLLIALMPTASTASIFGNTESFEVITSNLYTRNVLSGVFTILNKYLVKDLMTLDLWNQETKDRLLFDKGSVQNLKNFPSFLKDVYKTAFEVDQKLIVKMSAERGIYVCQSQSLNLYFDKPTFKELTSTHFYGWKSGLKTGMYYLRTKPAITGQNFGLDSKTEKILKKEEVQEECLSCGA